MDDNTPMEQSGEVAAARESPAVAKKSPRSGNPQWRAWKRQGLGAAAVAVALAAAWGLSLTPPLQQLEYKLYDLTMIYAGEQPPPPGIVLVTIDPETEQAIPAPRILWHPQFAALLRALGAGEARAAGLDLMFSISVEPWAPDYDRELAAAFAEISSTTPIVLVFDSMNATPTELPLYMLASTQGLMGFANVTLDADGFVRRQQLISSDGQWEAFAARLAAVVTGETWNRPQTDGRAAPALQLGSRNIPLDSEGALPIHYYGPDGRFTRVSMIEVLRAAERGDQQALRQWFSGKVALVGTTESADRQPTPFYRASNPPEQTSGVEIHANTLATILEGRFLRPAPQWAALLLALAAALAAAAMTRWFSSRGRIHFGVAGLVVLAAGYLALSVLLLRAGAVLPGVPVLLALALSAGATYAAQSLTEGRQRRLLQEVFGRYVSDDVARELLEYGEIPLGGARQQVTVMFTDLRNYTSYCEGRDPRQVVDELNEYFAYMSAEIKAHGGMINKFIGDGIMALWGAPVEHADDARRAVACGLRLVERNREYNQRRKEQNLAPLLVGIGVHTGQALVGNIGSPEKMEYTAIGETVNRAARIEGENKSFGTQFLISETTYHLVADFVAAECVGYGNLKGVSESVALYRVTGLK